MISKMQPLEVIEQITVETQTVSPQRTAREQFSPVVSASLTISGALVAGLGTDLIAFGKFRYQRTATLSSGSVLTAAGCLSVLVAQLAARPPVKLKALITVFFGIALGGIAVAQIGASRYYEAVGSANRNSNIFTAGVVIAALGSAVFLPALVEQYRSASTINIRMITTLSASILAVCSSLVVGFGAASYGNMVWARSLFAVTMIVAIAVIVISVMPHNLHDDANQNAAV